MPPNCLHNANRVMGFWGASYLSPKAASNLAAELGLTGITPVQKDTLTERWSTAITWIWQPNCIKWQPGWTMPKLGHWSLHQGGLNRKGVSWSRGSLAKVHLYWVVGFPWHPKMVMETQILDLKFGVSWQKLLGKSKFWGRVSERKPKFQL